MVCQSRRTRSRPATPTSSRRSPGCAAQDPRGDHVLGSAQPMMSQVVGEPLVCDQRLVDGLLRLTTAAASNGIMATIERTRTGTASPSGSSDAVIEHSGPDRPRVPPSQGASAIRAKCRRNCSGSGSSAGGCPTRAGSPRLWPSTVKLAAIHPVASDCSRSPWTGRWDRSRGPMSSSPMNPPSNRLEPFSSSRFTHQ